MPPRSEDQPTPAQAAVNLIRAKVARLYAREPDVVDEMSEAKIATPRSRHQQFMYELGTSGKDLATIQTEWHSYYQNLSDKEKFEVWQEFYDSQSKLKAVTNLPPEDKIHVMAETKKPQSRPRPVLKKDKRSTEEIRRTLLDKINAGGRLSLRHHIESLLFGLGIGTVVVVIFLFGFFNEVFLAPFIQPSRASAATPLIIGEGSPPPTPNPEVIIPKINLEIPVDYSESSTNESVIENDLNGGVVHYPTTVLPGQIGNTAYFGHSSNNIFNPGKYKFAFVLLHTLVKGDTFYLTYNDKLFAYKVISKSIVPPSDVSVLNPVPGQTATATLITCDPPGTSINRLIVVGQQVSPNPAGNSTASPTVSSSSTVQPSQLPGNGPTLWSKFIGSAIGKAISFVVIATAALFITKPFWRRAVD